MKLKEMLRGGNLAAAVERPLRCAKQCASGEIILSGCQRAGAIERHFEQLA
jgi:hypothetical protein